MKNAKSTAVKYIELNIRALEEKKGKTKPEEDYLGQLKRQLNAHKLGIVS